jgi:ribosome-associated heat shock protein Hsp15
MADQTTANQRQRIDKWLFFARMAKSRTLAQEWVEAGHVTVNGEKVRRSSADIRVGDRIGVTTRERDLVLIVKAPGERRGPFEEACHLYEDLSPPPTRHTAFEQAQREAGSGRPEKKERREIDRLKNGGFFGQD